MSVTYISVYSYVTSSFHQYALICMYIYTHTLINPNFIVSFLNVHKLLYHLYLCIEHQVIYKYAPLHNLYLLSLANFFLFRRAKEALAAITLDHGGLENAWEVVIRTATAADCATAFQRWFERAEK